MQATTFLYSSTALLHQHPAAVFSPLPCRRKHNILAMNSKGRDYGGRLVDENMIVLRIRIREAKLLEATDNNQLPSHWMEWEKKYYVDYNQDVCEAVGLLQNYLMNIRPGFALGIIALVTLTVLLSSGVLFIHALKIAQVIISGFI